MVLVVNGQRERGVELGLTVRTENLDGRAVVVDNVSSTMHGTVINFISLHILGGHRHLTLSLVIEIVSTEMDDGRSGSHVTMDDSRLDGRVVSMDNNGRSVSSMDVSRLGTTVQNMDVISLSSTDNGVSDVSGRLDDDMRPDRVAGIVFFNYGLLFFNNGSRRNDDLGIVVVILLVVPAMHPLASSVAHFNVSLIFRFEIC